MNEKDIEKLDLDKLSLKDIDEYVSDHEKELKYKETRNTVQFEIIKSWGKLSELKNLPILSLINLNGYTRYDIRGWNNDMSIPRKGISFSREEIVQLLKDWKSFNFTRIGSTIMYEYKSDKENAKLYENISILSETQVQMKSGIRK